MTQGKRTMTPAEIPADIKRRHSLLHRVDEECTQVMCCLIAMQPACSDHGLTSELKAVGDAVKELHAKAKAKWEATQ
jgi:hypothetical protein